MTTTPNSLHESLVSALAGKDEQRLVVELVNTRAADIAELFELLDEEERSQIIYALPPQTAAEVVVMLGEAVRSDVVEDMDAKSLSELVSVLPPDDAADVLGDLSEREADQVLEHMSDEQSDKIEELLEYDEETAGGIMTPDVVAIPATATVSDAVEYVRAATPDEELYEVYIVDDEHKLLGTVALRRLVTSPPATRLLDLADPNVVTVDVTEDQEAVVQIIRKYDVAEAAVVDDQGRLLGRITHDDLLDVAEEEAAEDMYRMAGTDASELETSSVFRAAWIRLTWLLPCLLGTLVTATVMLMSKPKFDLVLFTVLAAFSPMLGAMGGNTGVQISTIIVRGFAAGELASTRFFRALWREGRIALALAPVCGIAAWVLVSLCIPFVLRAEGTGIVEASSRVALSVGLAMPVAILISGLLGIALPFTFRRLGVDPAIASGPIVTTLNDIVSVTVYMFVAMSLTRQ